MMTICVSHWEQMRDKLKEFGIDHIGAKTSEEALAWVEAHAERGLDTPIPDSEWDPMLTMTSNFIGYVISRVGMNAQGCPLCLVRADFDLHNTPEGRCGEPECSIQLKPGEDPWDVQWIDTCGEVMRAEAVKRGLVKVS